MGILTGITRGIGALGIVITLADSHYMGKRQSGREAQERVSKALVDQHMRMSKANIASPLYNDASKTVKEFLSYDDASLYYTAKGYFKGFAAGLAEHYLVLGFSAIAIAAAKRTFLRWVGVVGAIGSAVWGFVKNSSGLFDKRNQLD